MQSQDPVDNEEFEQLAATMKERKDIVDKQGNETKLRLYSLGQ